MEIKDQPAEGIEQHASIVIIQGYRTSGVRPSHQIVNDSRILCSQRSGHDEALQPTSSKIKT
jgi:hypothetical protein